MIIRFYSITGRTESIENEVRALVNDIKAELAKRGVGEDKVRLTIIKVRGDVIDDVIKYLDQPEGKIPGQYKSLIVRMRQDGVSSFPAMVINDRKVAEGSELTMDAIKAALAKELKEEFNLEIPSVTSPIPQAQPVSTPQPQPIQPPPPPPPEIPPPQAIQPQPVKPITPPPTPPPPVTLQTPPTPPQPTQVQQTVTIPETPVTTGELGFKIVNGRPDNCNDCVYYGAHKGYCYLFGFRVNDPSKPPCKSIA
ncbi:hypothetical protein [Caldivirga maquilingensis]|uniref:Thioredoxin-like fold domain-containing protein n=1 Tax=Caldivirga maquilingensis (strain ATCC 700844 / DSM 13496 / JCM 10307 / IC-167) TaxID=397948 RepID=A8ME15_CALMQ|nr:hypothetical protein [Caldivirga maquilingensis]ABW02021.1 conserved hypothetical protein [Caldivirga maquilingensis IC-167]